MDVDLATVASTNFRWDLPPLADIPGSVQRAHGGCSASRQEAWLACRTGSIHGSAVRLTGGSTLASHAHAVQVADPFCLIPLPGASRLSGASLAGAEAPAVRFRHCAVTAQAVLAEPAGGERFGLASRTAMASWRSAAALSVSAGPHLAVGRSAGGLGRPLTRLVTFATIS